MFHINRDQKQIIPTAYTVDSNSKCDLIRLVISPPRDWCSSTRICVYRKRKSLRS